MLNSPKKIYLDGTVVHKKKIKAGISPGNNGIDLGNWIEKSIQTGSINVGSSVNSLDDLTDVTVGSPANGDVLTYNSTLQKFVNGPAPASVTGNITQGVLNLPTGDRTISMGANQLTFTGSKYQKFYVSTQTDLYTEVIADVTASRLVYYNDTGTNHINNVSFASIAGAGSLTNEGQIAVFSTGDVVISSNSKVYKLGDSSGLAPNYYDALANAPQTLVLNAANNKIFRVNTAFQFLSATQIGASNIYHPTKTEIETFLFSLGASTQSGNLNRYFYYNGTDDSTINYTYVYYLTGDNKLIEVHKPEEYWFSTAIGLPGDLITADAVSPLAQVGNLYKVDRTVDSFMVTWNANNSSGNASIGIIDNASWQFISSYIPLDLTFNPFYSIQLGGEYILDSTNIQDLRRQAYALKVSSFSAGAVMDSPRMSFRVRKNS